jgi:hypothetical protein
LTVVPSHPVDASVGKFATSPPGSEHSIISRPLGSAECTGNPVPDTVMVCPSVNGPPGERFTAVVAKAVPPKDASVVTVAERKSVSVAPATRTPFARVCCISTTHPFVGG